MEKKYIRINYAEYTSKSELELQDRELLDKAIEATGTSYAPYSSFNVGAAVKLSNGEIICASNQENAAYPSGLCAERTALFYAHAKYPAESVVAIAVVAKSSGEITKGLTYPCGACRQVLYEFQPDDYEIDVITENLGALEIQKLSYFLPCGFRI